MDGILFSCMCMYDTLSFTFNLVQSEIVAGIVDHVTNETNRAVFTCQATGEPVPNINWYINGVMINVSDTNKYMIISTLINATTTENTLTVCNVASSDVGTYTCNATNIIGDDQSFGILTVNGKQLSDVNIVVL